MDATFLTFNLDTQRHSKKLNKYPQINSFRSETASVRHTGLASKSHNKHSLSLGGKKEMMTDSEGNTSKNVLCTTFKIIVISLAEGYFHAAANVLAFITVTHGHL